MYDRGKPGGVTLFAAEKAQSPDDVCYPRSLQMQPTVLASVSN